MILLMICWCKSAKADLWATSNWITLIALRSAASTFSFPLWLPGTAWVLRQFIETGFVRWRNYAYNIAESIYGPLYFLTYSMLLHLQHLPICKLTLWRITRWWDHIVMPLFLAVLRNSSRCCSSARWFNASQSSPPAKRHNKYLGWAGHGVQGHRRDHLVLQRGHPGSLEISFGPKSATALRMRLGWRLVQVLFLDSAKLFQWTFESTPGKVVNRIINQIVNWIVNRLVNLINLTWEQTKGIQRNTSSRSC